MAGYIVKIEAKLLVKDTSHKEMTAASAVLDGLARHLEQLGLCDMEIGTSWKPKLVTDAAYNDASDQTQDGKP